MNDQEMVERTVPYARATMEDPLGDDIHTAVEHSRHTVRNLTIAGLVVLAEIAVFGTRRTRH